MEYRDETDDQGKLSPFFSQSHQPATWLLSFPLPIGSIHPSLMILWWLFVDMVNGEWRHVAEECNLVSFLSTSPRNLQSVKRNLRGSFVPRIGLFFCWMSHMLNDKKEKRRKWHWRFSGTIPKKKKKKKKKMEPRKEGGSEKERARFFVFVYLRRATEDRVIDRTTFLTAFCTWIDRLAFLLAHTYPIIFVATTSSFLSLWTVWVKSQTGEPVFLALGRQNLSFPLSSERRECLWGRSPMAKKYKCPNPTRFPLCPFHLPNHQQLPSMLPRPSRSTRSASSAPPSPPTRPVSRSSSSSRCGSPPT